MSDSRDIELIKDPGLPEHVHRSTDIDPKAAKRAERQIAILFVLIFSPRHPSCRFTVAFSSSRRYIRLGLVPLS